MITQLCDRQIEMCANMARGTGGIQFFERGFHQGQSLVELLPRLRPITQRPQLTPPDSLV